MAAVILSETAQKRIVELEHSMDVFLVPVDRRDPDVSLIPSADYSRLDKSQLSALNQLENDIDCLLLAMEHR